jgi:hypothetical protein
MPRCPLCRSAHITIVESLYPQAVCSGCGARWIQDGRQQSAITTGPPNPHSWPRPDSPGPASWPSPATTPPTATAQQPRARFLETSPW